MIAYRADDGETTLDENVGFVDTLVCLGGGCFEATISRVFFVIYDDTNAELLSAPPWPPNRSFNPWKLFTTKVRVSSRIRKFGSFFWGRISSVVIDDLGIEEEVLKLFVCLLDGIMFEISWKSLKEVVYKDSILIFESRINLVLNLYLEKGEEEMKEVII